MRKACSGILFFFLIDDEPKTVEYISKNLGVNVEQIKPFLKEIIKEGKVVEKEGRYGTSEQGAKKED